MVLGVGGVLEEELAEGEGVVVGEEGREHEVDAPEAGIREVLLGAGIVGAEEGVASACRGRRQSCRAARRSSGPSPCGHAGVSTPFPPGATTPGNTGSPDPRLLRLAPVDHRQLPHGHRSTEGLPPPDTSGSAVCRAAGVRATAARRRIPVRPHQKAVRIVGWRSGVMHWAPG